VLKVFGCTCYPLLRPYNSCKLMYRSKKCIFLGYCSNYKGYKCYDPLSKKNIISKHVVFNANTFPTQDWITSLHGTPATDSVSFKVISFKFTPATSAPTQSHDQPTVTLIVPTFDPVEPNSPQLSSPPSTNISLHSPVDSTPI
jgi:hypothetical protein